jgi:hypothetical protein
MTTWYEVNSWSIDIKSVEVVKETAHTLTVRSTAYLKNKMITTVCKKVSSNYLYFPTWAQARDHLLSRTESKIKTARARLDQEVRNLDAVQALTHP